MEMNNYKGFEVIDKSTGEPITESRYTELSKKLTGESLSYERKRIGIFNPEHFSFFLDRDGNLIEWIEEPNDYWQCWMTRVIKSPLMDSDEIEVRLK